MSRIEVVIGVISPVVQAHRKPPETGPHYDLNDERRGRPKGSVFRD